MQYDCLTESDFDTGERTKFELNKTMQNSADAASKAATDLNNAKAAARETDAEIKKLTEELYRIHQRRERRRPAG
jgi:methyl-accepting chemotaxis protein